ncbi:hypothetical protein ABZS29_02880 [Kribbella sp. NPDC005582]|uniref:hypothetical protein n=1 Tax=Kribbella sp. NPDC005582 TaxID=3156893 RepID=UPI0033BEC390
MSLYMRAVIRDWPEHELGDLVAFLREQDEGFTVSGGDWADFEIQDLRGVAVLAADLTLGNEVREELAELTEFLSDHEGSVAAQQKVKAHLENASAVVGMQVLMSRYDDSVLAANQLITFLERSPGVLTQVDTVGWYDGDELILQEAE